MNGLLSLKTYTGDFIPRSSGGGTVANGSPIGTLLTLTPPSGQRVRVTNLSTIPNVGIPLISQVQLNFGSIEIWDGGVSGSDPDRTGRISIGAYQEYPSGDPPLGNYNHITGAVDEQFIVATTKITEQILYYGYEFGE